MPKATSPVFPAVKTSPPICQPVTFIPYDLNTTAWQLPTPNSVIDNLSSTDYQLYQHYLSDVSPTLAVEMTPGSGIWDSAVRNNAQTRPFLLSGMLATSAVHMALSHHERREEFIQIAMRHQNQALREYRPVVSAGLDPAEYESAFGFTALLVVTAFGLQSALFKHSIETLEIQHADPIVEIQNIVSLCRGMTHIYRAGFFGSRVRLSPSPAFEHDTSPVFLPSCPGEVSLDMLERDFLEHDYQRAHIDVMEALDWDFAMPVPEDLAPSLPAMSDHAQFQPPSLKSPTDVYIYLIRRLRKVLREMRTSGDVTPYTLLWASCVPRAFSAALGVHRPLALVLVAHWAVSLHYLRSQWWADDWGMRLVATVARILGDEWRKYMLWPLQEVGLEQDGFLTRDMEIEGIQPLV